MAPEYESEVTVSRDEVATALRDVADGVDAGAVRLGEDDEAVSVNIPAELDLEVELESEDDELSLEIELEWPDPERGDGTESAETVDGTDGEGSDQPVEATVEAGSDAETSAVDEETTAPVPVRAATPLATLARFELFRDRADEWRWRLVHRNGNIIATSGEGYTRKHNARKGLQSVMENAPEAAVSEDDG